jgi:cysteinyl-tRNA synthetase
MGEKSFRQNHAAASLLDEGQKFLLTSGRILGLFQMAPVEYFSRQRRNFLRSKGLREEEIMELLAQRKAARQAKEWALADQIRARAGAWGILLEDGPKGTSWKPG